uniref:Uncharacterized protein n=1 Tax=Oryza nivara TaxID=4536 RepID=A0A0E0FQR5_ORYNI
MAVHRKARVCGPDHRPVGGMGEPDGEVEGVCVISRWVEAAGEGPREWPIERRPTSTPASHLPRTTSPFAFLVVSTPHARTRRRRAATPPPVGFPISGNVATAAPMRMLCRARWFSPSPPLPPQASSLPSCQVPAVGTGEAVALAGARNECALSDAEAMGSSRIVRCNATYPVAITPRRDLPFAIHYKGKPCTWSY